MLAGAVEHLRERRTLEDERLHTNCIEPIEDLGRGGVQLCLAGNSPRASGELLEAPTSVQADGSAGAAAASVRRCPRRSVRRISGSMAIGELTTELAIVRSGATTTAAGVPRTS